MWWGLGARSNDRPPGRASPTGSVPGPLPTAPRCYWGSLKSVAVVVATMWESPEDNGCAGEMHALRPWIGPEKRIRVGISWDRRFILYRALVDRKKVDHREEVTSHAWSHD